jgi:hypothetical protein
MKAQPRAQLGAKPKNIATTVENLAGKYFRHKTKQRPAITVNWQCGTAIALPMAMDRFRSRAGSTLTQFH